MKTCARCQTAKPSAGFGANAARKDGLDFYSQDCRREEHKASRSRRTEQQRAKRREYNRVRRQDPVVKARARELQLAWRIANPEKYRASMARAAARRRAGYPPL